MKARSVSWTDPQSVQALLSRVSKAHAPATPAVLLPAGSAAARRAQSEFRPAKPAPMPSPKPAQAAGPQPSPAPQATAQVKGAPVPLPSLDADNPSDRLDILLAWVQDSYQCSGAFVADDNGLTLAAHGISEAHVSIVGPLLSSLIGIRTVPGIDATAGALWLGAQMMSWVEVKTARGGFCLGALRDDALHPRDLARLKEALELSVRDI